MGAPFTLQAQLLPLPTIPGGITGGLLNWLLDIFSLMMQIMITRIAMKATTPPTMPMMSVSSLFKVDWAGELILVFGFSVVGTDHMISSGSVVFGWIRFPLVCIDVEGCVEESVVSFLGSQVSSSSPTSTRSFPSRIKYKDQKNVSKVTLKLIIIAHQLNFLVQNI